MKIYNAKLVGFQSNEKMTIMYFAYKNKFIEGCGVITCSLFANQNEIKGIGTFELDKYYDIYVTSNNGYHNIRGMYEHVNKG